MKQSNYKYNQLTKQTKSFTQRTKHQIKTKHTVKQTTKKTPNKSNKKTTTKVKIYKHHNIQTTNQTANIIQQKPKSQEKRNMQHKPIPKPN